MTNNNTNALIDPMMKTSLMMSALFHVFVVVAMIIGIPFVTKPVIAPTKAISVELVDIGEITQTTRVAQPSKPKAEEPKPAAQTEEKPPAAPKMTAEAPPDLTQAKPEKPPVKPVPPPPEKLAAVPETKPTPPEKKPEPKLEPEETTNRRETQTQDFASLLKNLTPDAPDETDMAENLNAKESAAAPDGSMVPLGDRMTISEEDALRRQLAQCWNVMAGARYAEDLIVEVRVNVGRDRMVQQATIVDRGRYNRDPAFRAAADSAIRALRNPRCTPLMLPADKYDQWKETIIRFDPREML